MKSEDLVQETKTLLSSCLDDGKLESGEVLRIAMFVAERAAVIKGLSGAEKKALVVKVVEEAVAAAVPSERQAALGIPEALKLLPTVLDLAVAAAKGRIALKAVGGGWAGWGRALCCKSAAAVEAVQPGAPLAPVEPVPEKTPVKAAPVDHSHIAAAVAAAVAAALAAPPPEGPPLSPEQIVLPSELPSQESESHSPQPNLPNTAQRKESETAPSPDA